MKFRIMLFVAVAAAAWAQTPSGQRPQPPLTEVKAYLSLTDAQVQSLQQLRQQEAESLRSVHESMMQKHTALRQKLESGTTDAAALGALLLEIEALRKQIAQTQTSFQTQAVNVLTAEQKSKLKALEDAAKLRPAIEQATMLNLLSPPAGPGGLGPGPGFGLRMGGFGPGMGGGMGLGPGPGAGPMRFRHLQTPN